MLHLVPNIVIHLISEYLEAFKCFDLNENGHLSTRELKCAMRILGSNPTDSEVQKLVNEKDYDGKNFRNDGSYVHVGETGELDKIRLDHLEVGQIEGPV